MKKVLSALIIFVLFGSFLPGFSENRIASKSVISGTNIPYVQPHSYRHHGYYGRQYQRSGGTQVYRTHRHKYVSQSFNGYENSNFPRRSYYVPSYCQPGAAMHNGDYNPFCNQYKPYGSGMYINF